MKLTKAQRVVLEIASKLGTINVFPDQFGLVSGLEARGLMEGNGEYFNRKSTVTPAGRAALEESRK